MTPRNDEYVTNLAFFLMEKTGSIHGRYRGKMTAQQQRELFGRFIGKGTIIIDGHQEIILNRVKVCFGLDWDDRNEVRWNEL